MKKILAFFLLLSLFGSLSADAQTGEGNRKRVASKSKSIDQLIADKLADGNTFGVTGDNRSQVQELLSTYVMRLNGYKTVAIRNMTERKRIEKEKGELSSTLRAKLTELAFTAKQVDGLMAVAHGVSNETATQGQGVL